MCLQHSLRGLRRRSKSSENGLQSHPLPTPDSPPVRDASGSPGRPPTTNPIFRNRPPSPLSDLPSVRLPRPRFPVTTCQELWPPSHTRPPPLRPALGVGSKAVGLSDKMHALGPIGTARRDDCHGRCLLCTCLMLLRPSKRHLSQSADGYASELNEDETALVSRSGPRQRRRGGSGDGSPGRTR